jgi:hypothetical protein
VSASDPMTPRKIFETLDAISKRRALTDAESRELERVQRLIERNRSGQERSTPRAWSKEEDRALRVLMRRRGAVKVLAPLMGRTETALYRRAASLRQAEDRGGRAGKRD